MSAPRTGGMESCAVCSVLHPRDVWWAGYCAGHVNGFDVARQTILAAEIEKGVRSALAADAAERLVRIWEATTRANAAWRAQVGGGT